MRYASLLILLTMFLSFELNGEGGGKEEKPSKTMCVAGDNVNLRETPESGGKIKAQLFWLQEYYIIETAAVETIGKDTLPWLAVYGHFQDISIEGTGPRFIGYAYSKFFKDCGQAQQLFNKKIEGARTLADKLLWRKIFKVRLYPDGKSEKFSYYGGCCATSVSSTGNLRWKAVKDGIQIEYFYELTTTYETGENLKPTVETVKEKFIVKDLVLENGKWVLKTDRPKGDIILMAGPELIQLADELDI